MTISRRMLLCSPMVGLIGAALGADSKGEERSASGKGLVIRRLAWAGVRLEYSGIVVFIDAIAPDESAGQPGPPLVAGAGRNYALITHHHGDHFDPVALAGVLAKSGYLVCFEETARYCDTRTLQIQPVPHYEPVFLTRAGGEFAAFAVPAVDGLGSPQVSWVMDVGGKRLIHCGDTLWHGHWWDIARAYGPFDVAFLPINGFRNIEGRYSDEGIAMGMAPNEAAAAAHILKARLAVPIHYGAHEDPHYLQGPDPARTFEAAARAKGIAVRTMAPGESLELS